MTEQQPDPQPDQQPDPRTPGERAWWASGRVAAVAVASAVAGGLLGAGLFALVGSLASGGPFELTGKVTIVDAKQPGTFCPDLPDDRIHVVGEGGVIVAVGKLKKPKADARGNTCAYTFTVTDVPAGHASYGVMVPALNEPPLRYTEDVLRAQIPLEVTGTGGLTFPMIRP